MDEYGELSSISSATTSSLQNEEGNDAADRCSANSSGCQGSDEPMQKVGNTFRFDRNLIQEVEHDEQDEELQSLGLSVYNQETLEQGILDQVDKALEKQEKEEELRRVDKKIKAISEDIKSAEKHLSKDGNLLKALLQTRVQETQTFGVQKDKELRSKQLDSLRAQEKSLLIQRAELSRDQQEDGKSSTTIPEKKDEETEQERMIRLGEMTPFGTVLSLEQGNSRELSGLEKYMQSQAQLQRAKPSSSNKQSSKPQHMKCAPFKHNVLFPKKRKRKEGLGTKISRHLRNLSEKPDLQVSEIMTMDVDQDPDYQPESDEDFHFKDATPKKKKASPNKKPKKSQSSTHSLPMDNDSDSDWKSDDSDWLSSGGEESVKRQRKGTRYLDDGNIEDYNARIKAWEKSRNDLDDDKELHAMEGGLEIPKVLWNKLYKYQQVGVQWMWELYQNGTGGILGDEMGLGKTFQVIAFMAALRCSKLRSKHINFRGLGPCIVVCPTTVMHQWVREFHNWWPIIRVAVLHESGSFAGSRASLIREMNSAAGVLVTSYQGLVLHQEELLRRNWHLLVLDEGHKIRNPDAQATLASKRFTTPHRLALTGSPMQNNLRELWSLFDFVYPSRLGTLPDFLANFAVPITQGGYANATEIQVATAYHCALSLKENIKPFLLRRMKADVKVHIELPNKNEQVLFCKLSDEQRSLYQNYVDSRLVHNILEGHTKIFVGLINLRKICNHPDLFSGGPKLMTGEKIEDRPEDDRFGYWERAGKMVVVRSLLKIWQKQGHRVLLFTQGRQMLSILEAFIMQEGYKYLKLDGSTSISARQPLIAKFNQNPEFFMFLLTTRVGGLGVNLTGANRVIIYDPDWNPATDTQARERAWRIGQKNQVTIYRLVTAGTIEEKIYHRQIFKQFLTNKVLKDPRQRRFFKSNDLYELFTLKEGEKDGTETSAIFAGTGSEIHVDLNKRKHRRQGKHSEIPKIEPIPRKIEFSKEKIDHMKQLAQKLSQKFADAVALKKQTLNENKSSENESNFLEKDQTSKAADGNKPVEKCPIVNLNTDPKKSPDKHVKTCQPKMAKASVSSSQPSTSKSRNKHDSTSNKSCKKESHHRSDHKSGHKSNHKKHKKKHRNKGAKFEGERVSHLVKLSNFSDLSKEEEEEEGDNHKDQDDYVLRKLFSKSGLQTALKHDTIMEGGPSDYALVEREARNVAQEAVARLKESQQQCFNASLGIPTWTGQNGHQRPPRNREKRKKPPPPAAVGKAPDIDELPPVKESGPLSASGLLDFFNKRNRLQGPPKIEEQPLPEEPRVLPQDLEMSDIDDDENNPMDGNADLFYGGSPPQEDEEEMLEAELAQQAPNAEQEENKTGNAHVTQEESDLLDELRSFLSFGCEVSGQATTGELLAKFTESNMRKELSTLFKFLLQSVADFHRNSAGQGIWKLKQEFL